MNVLARLRTVGSLLVYFSRRERFFLAPLLIILLAASVLLLVTGGLSYVAPFVYALFWPPCSRLIHGNSDTLPRRKG